MLNLKTFGWIFILQIYLILFYISTLEAQTHRIVWFNYSTTGCVACHRIASLRLNDTLFLFGSFYTQNNKMIPILIMLDSSLNVKWYRAFNHQLSDLSIDKIERINDTLIAIIGGHVRLQNSISPVSFWGLFNIKIKDFVFQKYTTGDNVQFNFNTMGLAFGGNEVIISSHEDTKGNILSKFDISGNILWQRKIEFSPYDVNFSDILFDGSSYILVGSVGKPRLSMTKLDISGNVVWSKISEIPAIIYKAILDSDGYILCGFVEEQSDKAFITKIDFNGNVIWSKTYSLNGYLTRAYDITTDGTSLIVAGFMREINGNRSYPITLKINKQDGSIIFARYWNNVPEGSSNYAKGVVHISDNSFYIASFIGNQIDLSQGMAILKVNPLDQEDCTANLNIAVSDYSFNLTPITPILSSTNYQFNDFLFSSFLPLINQTSFCQITPIHNGEYVKSCEISIKTGKGYITLDASTRSKIQIYTLDGKPIHQEEFKGKRILKVRAGIYIIKLNEKRIKVVVK